MITVVQRVCPHHGLTDYYVSKDKPKECVKCSKKRMNAFRKDFKATLIQENGGKCSLCGYDKYPCSLQFHHLDPSQKLITLGGSRYSVQRLRQESWKCILVCANCHAAVEAGYITIPQEIIQKRLEQVALLTKSYEYGTLNSTS